MATICGMLARCSPTSKHIFKEHKRSILSSIKCLLFKGQVLQSLAVPLPSSHRIMFCSKATSGQSTERVKRHGELGFNNDRENHREPYRYSDGENHREPYRYSDESVDLIVSEILSTSKTISPDGLTYDVLEIIDDNAGKMTEQLRKKLPESMKYLASENFPAALKSKGLIGDVAFVTAGIKDRSVGNIVYSHCFHLFSDKENLDRIHRVLAPGGKLLLVWDMQQTENCTVTVEKQVGETTGDPVKEGLKKCAKCNLEKTLQWRKDIDASHDFRLLWHKSLQNVNTQGDLDSVIATVTTVPAYTSLPEVERDEYIMKLRMILKLWFGIIVNKPTIPHTTELYVYVVL